MTFLYSARASSCCLSFAKTPGQLPSSSKHRIWTACLIFSILGIFANCGIAQNSFQSSASSSAFNPPAVMRANTSAASGTANLTGSWSGTASDSNNDPGGNVYTQQFTFQQDATGNLSGTRKTTSQQNPAYWTVWSITGVISGSTFTFQDQTIVGGGFPSGTPCAISATVTLSADTNSFSGPWTSSNCQGVNINGTRSATDPAKNLGDGARCDGGEGSQDGGKQSGSGGSAGSSNCAEKNGAPNVSDPINASTGNKYLQEDDYTDSPWLPFRRFYNNSSAVAPTAMGVNWRHSFDRSLQFFGNPISTIVLFRPDGKQETFTKSNGVWTTELAFVDQLTETDNAQGVATGYTVFVGATQRSEFYGTAGKLRTVTDENGQGITLTYSDSTTSPSIAPKVGLLLSVTDSWNRQLGFTYDSNGNLHQVTLPDAATLTYAYDVNSGNLLSVKYPDSTIRQYVYNEHALTGGTNLPNAMTGIVDESGVRYESTAYDRLDRATSTYFAGNVGNTQITYNVDGTSSIKNPLGHTTNLGFTTADGLVRVGTVDQPCGPDCGQPWKTRTYDTNGYPASYTDFKGNLTTTQYNAYGLLHIEVDGSGTTNQRTTTTVWTPQWRKPVSRQVQNAQGAVLSQSSWAYNYLGEMNAHCDVDPAVPAATAYTCVNTGAAPAGVRRWQYHYCGSVDTTQCPIIGLLLSATGPRTDITQTSSYIYYMLDGANHKHGDLKSVTDPLGHVTTFLIYDGAGRVTSMQDANGTYTDMTYTPRGWLATRTVRVTSDNSPASSDAITKFSYWPFGAIKTITDPDGVVVTYNYDGAHRLTDVTDTLGNGIHYTLDVSGNKINEQVRNASGTTLKSSSPALNTLGQITSIVDGLGKTVFSANYSDSYDANGNLQHSADGAGYQQMLSFDALNRLESTIKNYNGTDTATNNATSVYQVDALDRLAALGDPDNLNTTYTFDGLSNKTKLRSPDTGTSTDTFDAAGNRRVHTDAKGVVSTSTYDALDRLTGTAYSDTSLNVAYHYDEANATTGCTASAPIGRLTRVVEGSVTTTFCYDGRGNVIQKRQATSATTDTTLYTYTLANRRNGISTPDHTAITYAYNPNGQVASVTVTPAGNTTASPTVVSNIVWLPFGPISSYTLGNGQSVTRTYDANYRLTDLTSVPFSLHLSRDVMGNVNGIGPAAGAHPAAESYQYDPLYRLKAVLEANGSTLESYTYNRTGDRLSKTTSGLASGVYGYTAGTHQLSNIGNVNQANDLNGNTTGSVIGANTYGFGYNGRNRMTIAQLNGQTVGSYVYNALDERISKVATSPQSIAVRYAYDEATHLLGEYGTTNRDYIWLGDLPIAVIDNTINGSVTTSVVNYIVADQLNTPRAIANSAGTTIWQLAYAGDPFGEQQPSSNGYVLNLRYAGQYYDAETGTNYNIHRTYEPATGRYLQSDPIGLNGGFSTYAYVAGSPLAFTDKLGLAQQLGYTTVTPGPGQSTNQDPWQIQWTLSEPSRAGGWIVQQNTITLPDGSQTTYWEAWQVAPSANETTQAAAMSGSGLVPVDDTFDVEPSSADVNFNASARFYEGLNLPKDFVPNSNPYAQALPATSNNPCLSTKGATPAVVRHWSPH